MEIVAYNSKWPKIFESEKEFILASLKNEILDIQHIGSTSVPGLAAKSIIDIAVLIPSLEHAQEYIQPLKHIGYEYHPDRSSVERYFFTKGEPPTFHLSLAQQEKFSYWQRQIFFRDYLIQHTDVAKEYEQLKKELIQKYTDGRQSYSDAKSDFIQKVLSLAEKSNN